MNINLGGARYGKKDVEKGIKIPTALTPELAEDIGMHIGDGSLYWFTKKKRSTELEYSFDSGGNSYRKYTLELKKKIYGLSGFRLYQYGNEMRLKFCSLAIATFYHKVLGFPIGKKSDSVSIPKIILNAKNPKILASCIRGIADTDFHVRINANGCRQIHARMNSKNLIKDMSMVLKKLEIGHTAVFDVDKFDKRSNRKYKMHHMYISGSQRFGEYVKKVGFSNKKNIQKVKKWARTDLNCRPPAHLASPSQVAKESHIRPAHQ